MGRSAFRFEQLMSGDNRRANMAGDAPVTAPVSEAPAKPPMTRQGRKSQRKGTRNSSRK